MSSILPHRLPRVNLRTALRALLHANASSLALFALLFGLLWLAGLGVPLSLVVSKAVSWLAFTAQLGLAAWRR